MVLPDAPQEQCSQVKPVRTKVSQNGTLFDKGPATPFSSSRSVAISHVRREAWGAERMAMPVFELICLLPFSLSAFLFSFCSAVLCCALRCSAVFWRCTWSWRVSAYPWCWSTYLGPWAPQPPPQGREKERKMRYTYLKKLCATSFVCKRLTERNNILLLWILWWQLSSGYVLGGLFLVMSKLVGLFLYLGTSNLQPGTTVDHQISYPGRDHFLPDSTIGELWRHLREMWE